MFPIVVGLVRIVGPGTYHYNIGSEQYILKSVKVEMMTIPKQYIPYEPETTSVPPHTFPRNSPHHHNKPQANKHILLVMNNAT
jgi:hypothetical protein